MQQRPASRAVSRTRSLAAPLSGAAFGIDQRAQIVESIGGDEPGGDQFPQRCLDFALQHFDAANDVGEERCAARLQEREHRFRAIAQAVGG